MVSARVRSTAGTPSPVTPPLRIFQAPDDPEEATGYWQRIRRFFPLFDVNTGTLNNGVEATARSTFADAPVRTDGAYDTIGTVPITASGYASPQPLVGQLSNR
jgi:hypothetical protein